MLYTSRVLAVLFLIFSSAIAQATCQEAEEGLAAWKEGWCPIFHNTCTEDPANVRSAAYSYYGTKLANNVTYVTCMSYDCTNVNPGQSGEYAIGAPFFCDSDFGSGGYGGNSAGACSSTQAGSIVRPETQVLGEIIPLNNSSFDLVYSSDRVVGNSAAYTIKMRAVGSDVRPSATSVDVKIYDETNTLVDSQSYLTSTLNQYHTFVWDGENASNVETWGSLNYRITAYENGTDINIDVPKNIGILKIKKLGVGGWAPSVWQFYDVNAQVLYQGDGSIRHVSATLITGSPNFYRIADQDGSLVHEFDADGRILRTKIGVTGTNIYEFTYSGDKLTAITEPHSMVTTFTYSSGDLVSITNPYSQVFDIDLDANGYIETLTSPASEVYEMTNSSGGLLLTFEKPNGATNTFTYSDGLLTNDTHSGGYYADLLSTLANGLPLKTYTSRMGRVTSYAGNGIDVPIVITLPSGDTETTSKSDLAFSRTAANGVTTSSVTVADTRFDGAFFTSSLSTQTPYKFVTTSEADTVTLSTPTDPFSITTWVKEITNGTIDNETTYTGGSTREYNTTTDVGRTFRKKIDTYGRVIEQQVGGLTKTEYTYTGKNLTDITQGARSTTIAYNGIGKVSSVTSPLSQVTSFSYDSAGRPDIITLPDTRAIDYDYDSVGRLTSVTPESRSAHVFNYNASEYMSEYAPPLISGIPNVTTDYTYDDDNQLTQIARPDGLTIYYAYDATTGRMSSITTPTRTITLSYYAGSNPVTYNTDAGIDVYRTYGGNDLIGESWYDNSSNLLGTYTSNLDSSYGDVASDVIDGGASGTRTITYSYDHDRVLKGTGDITLTYATPNGTLTSSTFGSIADAYGYNSFGEVTSYDSTVSSVNKYSLDFTRDALGRITQKIESINGGSSNTYDYTYDSTGRLTQVNKNSTTYATYSYDDNNNRTGGAVNGVTTTGVYDSQDRMTDYNTYDFTYNANGDMLTKTNTTTSVVWTYTYDVQGNLLSAAISSPSKTYNYEVDGLNRRIDKKDGSTFKSRYIYDSQNRLVGEINSNRTLKRRYVYVSKRNIPDYFYDGSTKYRIISDSLGSPRVVIKSDGTIMQTMEHDAFGRVTSNYVNGSFSPIAFGFAGGIYDLDTGLLRFGARDYDPETGRWLSKDPIRFSGGDSNLYGYVMNDPVNFVDPNGTTFHGALMGGLAGACGGAAAGFMTPIVGGAGFGAVVGFIGGAILGEIFSNPSEPTTDFGPGFGGGGMCSPRPPPGPPPGSPPTPPSGGSGSGGGMCGGGSNT